MENPQLVDGICEGCPELVQDEFGSVPTSAPVKHVEDDAFVHEYQITLHSCTECGRHIHGARIRWPSFGPFCTHGKFG